MARPKWRMPDVRLALVGAFFVLVWVGIGFRLVDVQALNAEQYADRGFEQRVRQEELAACHPGAAAERLPMWPGDRNFLPLVFDDDPAVFHVFTKISRCRREMITLVR